MIRTGIGGWTYPEWRGGTFYPRGLRQADELSYAARNLSAIEINGTYYRLQKPETFAKWRSAVPDGFVFAVKGSRYVTNRKVLAEAAEAVERFFAQGIAELGDALGPVLWQLDLRKQFDPDDIAAFFALLPAEIEGIALRHAIAAGHESFACKEFVDLARHHRVAISWTDDPERARIDDRTAPFAYARMRRARSDRKMGYGPKALGEIADMAKAWEAGDIPAGHAPLSDRKPATARDVFVFFINGAKEKAPAAAMALSERL